MSRRRNPFGDDDGKPLPPLQTGTIGDPEDWDEVARADLTNMREAWDVHDATLLMSDGDKRKADAAFKAHRDRFRTPPGHARLRKKRLLGAE